MSFKLHALLIDLEHLNGLLFDAKLKYESLQDITVTQELLSDKMEGLDADKIQYEEYFQEQINLAKNGYDSQVSSLTLHQALSGPGGYDGKYFRDQKAVAATEHEGTKQRLNSEKADFLKEVDAKYAQAAQKLSKLEDDFNKAQAEYDDTKQVALAKVNSIVFKAQNQGLVLSSTPSIKTLSHKAHETSSSTSHEDVFDQIDGVRKEISASFADAEDGRELSDLEIMARLEELAQEEGAFLGSDGVPDSASGITSLAGWSWFFLGGNRSIDTTARIFQNSDSTFAQNTINKAQLSKAHALSNGVNNAIMIKGMISSWGKRFNQGDEDIEPSFLNVFFEDVGPYLDGLQIVGMLGQSFAQQQLIKRVQKIVEYHANIAKYAKAHKDYFDTVGYIEYGRHYFVTETDAEKLDRAHAVFQNERAILFQTKTGELEEFSRRNHEVYTREIKAYEIRVEITEKIEELLRKQPFGPSTVEGKLTSRNASKVVKWIEEQIKSTSEKRKMLSEQVNLYSFQIEQIGEKDKAYNAFRKDLQSGLEQYYNLSMKLDAYKRFVAYGSEENIFLEYAFKGKHHEVAGYSIIDGSHKEYYQETAEKYARGREQNASIFREQFLKEYEKFQPVLTDDGLENFMGKESTHDGLKDPDADPSLDRKMLQSERVAKMLDLLGGGAYIARAIGWNVAAEDLSGLAGAGTRLYLVDAILGFASTGLDLGATHRGFTKSATTLLGKGAAVANVGAGLASGIASSFWAADLGSLLNSEDVSEDDKAYIKAEIALQSMMVIAGAAHTALATIMAVQVNTKAASFASKAVPVIGMLMSAVSAINPLKWKEFQDREGYINQVKKRSDYSAKLYSEMLSDVLGVEKAFYGSTTALDSGVGVLTSALMLTGVGAPVAALIGLVGGFVSMTVQAFQQQEIERAVDYIVDKMRIDENGKSQTIAEFFDHSFDAQQGELREAVEEQFREYIKSGSLDSIIGVGTRTLTNTDKELIAMGKLGDKYGNSAKHYFDQYKYDAETQEDKWDSRVVQVEVAPGQDRVILPEVTENGKSVFLTFMSVLGTSGEEISHRMRVSSSAYKTTLTIKDIAGWIIQDSGSNNTTFNISKMVTSGENVEGIGVDISLSIEAGAGDDNLFAFGSPLTFDGGDGTDVASYVSLRPEDMDDGLVFFIAPDGEGEEIAVKKVLAPGSFHYEQKIGEAGARAGTRIEANEFISLIGSTRLKREVYQDKLLNVEKVQGSSGDDVFNLSGSSNITQIDGFDGDDRIFAGAFTDTVSGGAGDDEIILNSEFFIRLADGEPREETLQLAGGSGTDTLVIDRNIFWFLQKIFETMQTGEYAGPYRWIEKLFLQDIERVRISIDNAPARGESWGTYKDYKTAALKGEASTNPDYNAVYYLEDYEKIIELTLGARQVSTNQKTPPKKLQAMLSAEEVDHRVTLLGSKDDDGQIGSRYSDSLLGMSGDDTLEGGAGNDILAGGDGDDRFVFDGSSGHDLVSVLNNIEGLGDELYFTDVARLDFYQDGADLVIFHAKDASVTFRSFFSSYNNENYYNLNSFRQLVFDDGSGGAVDVISVHDVARLARHRSLSEHIDEKSYAIYKVSRAALDPILDPVQTKGMNAKFQNSLGLSLRKYGLELHTVQPENGRHYIHPHAVDILGDNLISNGSFESFDIDISSGSVSANVIFGWEMRTDNEGEFQIIRDDRAEGENVLNLDAFDADQNVEKLKRVVNIDEKGRYLLSFILKFPEGSPSDVSNRLKVLWNGANVMDVSSGQQIDGREDYWHFAFEVIGQKGANDLIFSETASGSDGKGLLLDDIHLHEMMPRLQTENENLIINGSFEETDDTGRVMGPWRLSLPSSLSDRIYVEDDMEARAVPDGVSVLNLYSGMDRIQKIQQYVDTEKGKTYVLSFYLRSEEGSLREIANGVQIRWNDKFIANTHGSGQVGDWDLSYQRVEFEVVGTGGRDLLSLSDIRAVNSLWIDDVRLHKKKENLIVNGSFEAINGEGILESPWEDAGYGYFLRPKRDKGAVVVPDGVNVLNMDPGTGSYRRIQQYVDTEEGATYVLSFYIKAEHGSLREKTNGIQIRWNGEFVANTHYSGQVDKDWTPSYQRVEFEVVGTGGRDLLFLTEMWAGRDGRGLWIDDVVLREKGSDGVQQVIAGGGGNPHALWTELPAPPSHGVRSKLGDNLIVNGDFDTMTSHGWGGGRSVGRYKNEGNGVKYTLPIDISFARDVLVQKVSAQEDESYLLEFSLVLTPDELAFDKTSGAIEIYWNDELLGIAAVDPRAYNVALISKFASDYGYDYDDLVSIADARIVDYNYLAAKAYKPIKNMGDIKVLLNMVERSDLKRALALSAEERDELTLVVDYQFIVKGGIGVDELKFQEVSHADENHLPSNDGKGAYITDISLRSLMGETTRSASLIPNGGFEENYSHYEYHTSASGTNDKWNWFWDKNIPNWSVDTSAVIWRSGNAGVTAPTGEAGDNFMLYLSHNGGTDYIKQDIITEDKVVYELSFVLAGDPDWKWGTDMIQVKWDGESVGYAQPYGENHGDFNEFKFLLIGDGDESGEELWIGEAERTDQADTPGALIDNIELRKVMRYTPSGDMQTLMQTDDGFMFL